MIAAHITASASSSCHSMTSTATAASEARLSGLNMVYTVGLLITCVIIFTTLGVVMGVALYTRRRRRQSRGDEEQSQVEPSSRNITIIIKSGNKVLRSLEISPTAEIETPVSPDKFTRIRESAYQGHDTTPLAPQDPDKTNLGRTYEMQSPSIPPELGTEDKRIPTVVSKTPETTSMSFEMPAP